MSSEEKDCTLKEHVGKIEGKTVINTSHNEIIATISKLSSQIASLATTNAPTDDPGSFRKLCLWLAQIALPTGQSVSYDDFLDESARESQVLALSQTKERATYSLEALNEIFQSSSAPSVIDHSILLTLLAYTSTTDPWTTPATVSLVNKLLDRFTDQIMSISFITINLLQEFIRPLFAKSKKIETISTTGRKAMPNSAPPSRFDSSELDRERQPWRYEVVYAVSILDWAISNISSDAITPNLHLLLPPLLHLLDTSSAILRQRGLLILPKLLQKMTPQTLTQTGLGFVFEDAVAPTLMFLPSLTPIKESELLVPAAWEAIFTLCDVWFSKLHPASQAKPNNSTTSSSSPRMNPAPTGLPKISVGPDFSATSTTKLLPLRSKPPTTADHENEIYLKKTDYLLRHLRESLLPAFTYTRPAYPSLTTILLQQLYAIIPRLGVYATKHLKDIILLSTSILLDPFSKTDMLVGSLDVLRVVLLNCWARIASEEDGKWRMEILKGFVGCWAAIRLASVQDGSMTEVEELKRQLGIVARLLVAVVEVDEVGERVKEFKGYIETLSERDDGLRVIFTKDEA